MSTATMSPESLNQHGQVNPTDTPELEMPVAGARPNHIPAPEVSEAARDPFEFLSVQAISELRDRQHELVSREQENLHPLDVTGREFARKKAYNEFGDLRREYLHDVAGIKESDPAYANYMGYLERFSLDKMPDHEWWAGEYDQDGKMLSESGRRQLQEIHDENLKMRQALAPDTQPAAPAMPIEVKTL